jgi:hypothetical protein
MGLLAFFVIVAALVSAPCTAGADTRLTFGKPPSEVETALGYSAAVEGPSVDLDLGTEVGGKTPVSVPADAFRLPLVRTDSDRPWLRRGPTVLRLVGPAAGDLSVENDRPVLRLAGRLVLENADGKVLKEFEVAVVTEFPDGYVSGGELEFRVSAQAVRGGKPVGTPVSMVLAGRIEEQP